MKRKEKAKVRKSKRGGGNEGKDKEGGGGNESKVGEEK